MERSVYPREKVCGDGLTPRAVKQVERMGVDTHDPIFERIRGLRVYSRRTTLELEWPRLDDWPDYALVATRSDLDRLLAERAEKAGARVLQGTEAVAPILRDAWVAGATVRPTAERDVQQTEIRAKLVFAADGAASRFASAAGVRRDTSRPLGIAARRYYRTDRHPGPWFESWLDLWEGDQLLPGYGWLFPLTDGTLNLGAGLLNTFKNFQEVSAQRLFDAFIAMMPPSWDISEDSARGRVLSGPLPMGMNRYPLAVPGLLLIGDAAGTVSPFNGEGISYAMETGEIAAELAHDALVSGRIGRAMLYPTVLRETYGSYFTMGRLFAKAIGDPRIMQASTRLLLPNEAVMRFAMRLLANLTDGKDGDAQDKLFYVMERLAPAS